MYMDGVGIRPALLGLGKRLASAGVGHLMEGRGLAASTRAVAAGNDDEGGEERERENPQHLRSCNTRPGWRRLPEQAGTRPDLPRADAPAPGVASLMADLDH
jgi:hypothetical protein